MSNQVPKAVKVENNANILRIEFDNGVVKYLKSHYNEDLVNSYSLKKGKGKRINLILAPHNMWIGTEITIKSDGTVILNEKDKYTPEELWNNGREHIAEL
ncbi:hypothetical protein ACS127_12725 [Amphibacillus sp. Q70]|uniref:hypothetical protein n=1 Tax=Amphibacillus sp. Q70 TaxID=3453416 RepID=UPI003F875EE7